MSVLVLDSEALWRLARDQSGRADAAQAAVTAALARDVDVVVPAAVLADLYEVVVMTRPSTPVWDAVAPLPW